MSSLFYKILCTFLILICSFGTYAQNTSKYKFGLRGSLNYTTIGSRYSQYSGSGEYGVGFFGTKTLSPRLIASVEPSFAVNSFRQTQSDSRYKYTYADVSLNAFYDLFNSEAIYIYLGLRPGYLLNYRSEIFQAGSYITDNNATLKNKEGQIDLGINAGVSVKLSRVINLDMGYMWSSTNATTSSQAQGRPSFFEVSLKLNAIDLKNVMEQKENNISEQIKTYKKGALLVMLQTYSEKDFAGISAARWEMAKTDLGLPPLKMDQEAIKSLLYKDLNLLNYHIMSEFKRNFPFAPVYFFMDTSLNKLLLGDTRGIFVNEGLEADTNLMLRDEQNFFIAGFANDFSKSTQKINYGLYLYDNKMKSLDRPFNVNAQAMSVYFNMSPAAALSDIQKLVRTLEMAKLEINEENLLTLRKGLYQSMSFGKNIIKLNGRLTRYATLD
ncbi:MAG: outer membrane beta-barrel protein [Bacteroidota bacterium]